MERRVARVSEAQWDIILEFLERNPCLARSRRYNNSARGRAVSLRLWQEVAGLLNSERSGTRKTPRDWATYVSNYKSKLNKTIADINAEAISTGREPPRASSLSDVEQRFLAIMGSEAVPQALQPPSTAMSQPLDLNSTEDMQQDETAFGEVPIAPTSDSPVVAELSIIDTPAASSNSEGTKSPRIPRRARRARFRSRPLAPLDEARRILSQAVMQRAAADVASARALDRIAQNLGRLADAAERYFMPVLDETTPKVEVKERKLTQSRVPTPTIEKKDIPIFITSAKRGYITQKISDHIQEGLNAILDSLASGDLNVQGPAFLGKPIYSEGTLRLLCADQATVDWTRTAVTELSIPETGKLVVLHSWDIPKKVKCGILIPHIFNGDTKMIGRHLLMSNPWASVERWLVHAIQPQESTGSSFVVVSVPENIVPDILRRGRRLSFRLGAVYIKFLGANGRYIDTPPGSTDNQLKNRLTVEDKSPQTFEELLARETSSSEQGPSQGVPPASEEVLHGMGSSELDGENASSSFKH